MPISPRSRRCVLLAALALSGCVSASIDSRFVSPYEGPVNGVLLVTRFGEFDAKFERAFVAEVEMGLQARGMIVVHRAIAPNSTGPTTVDAREAGASALLVVEIVDSVVQTVAPGMGATGMGMGQASRKSMDVSFSPVEVGRAIWKADLEARGSNSVPEHEAQRAGRRLVESLEADGLVAAER